MGNPRKIPGSALSDQNCRSEMLNLMGMRCLAPLKVLRDRLNVTHLNACEAHINRLEISCWVWPPLKLKTVPGCDSHIQGLLWLVLAMCSFLLKNKKIIKNNNKKKALKNLALAIPLLSSWWLLLLVFYLTLAKSPLEIKREKKKFDGSGHVNKRLPVNETKAVLRKGE